MHCTIGQEMSAVSGEIVNSAVAGVIAALTATLILGIARWIIDNRAKRREISILREILTDGRKRVYDARDTFHQAMGVTSPADYLRVAQYNNMVKRLDVALKNWTPNLSHKRKKAILNALDWYHTDGLMAVKREGKAVWVELVEGKWPTEEMTLEAARKKFGNIEEICWLRMKEQ